MGLLGTGICFICRENLEHYGLRMSMKYEHDCWNCKYNDFFIFCTRRIGRDDCFMPILCLEIFEEVRL